jgi:tRNA acetyltransferase TAN1
LENWLKKLLKIYKMSSNENKRKKTKNWFSKNAKKPRRAFSLGPDQKGFLLTCNFRERETIREAYQLLNEYADRMYGPEVAVAGDQQGEEDDIDASLEAETKALKAQVGFYEVEN